MKYIHFIISMLFFLGFASSTICAQTLYVRQKTGEQTNDSLTGIRNLSFTPGKLNVLKTGSNSDEYLIEFIRNLSFSDITLWIDDPLPDESKTSFIICPNPAHESIKIAATGNETLFGIIELINLNGYVVKSLTTNGVREMDVDVGGICKGIYLCRFTDGNKVETLKFIKQ